MSLQAPKTAFETWAAQIPTDDLETELADLEREWATQKEQYQDARRRAEAAAERLRGLEKNLEARRTFLKAVVTLADANGGPASEGSAPNVEPPEAERSLNGACSDPPRTKPLVIQLILEDVGKPMLPRELRAAAIRRGWLNTDAASGNQLSVAANKMAHDGRLVKDEDGRYALPDLNLAALALEGGNAD